MIQQVTKGIHIAVETDFDGTFERLGHQYHAFTYHITITNHSKDVVQLLNRHWNILDALNTKEIVEGEGVIGNKPILRPGQSHNYTSHSYISSPLGVMNGWYEMINFTSTSKFKVLIPSFKLSATYALN